MRRRELFKNRDISSDKTCIKDDWTGKALSIRKMVSSIFSLCLESLRQSPAASYPFLFPAFLLRRRHCRRHLRGSHLGGDRPVRELLL